MSSISVIGDYDWTNPLFNITYGNSKDKRPALKQFLAKMLCVERSISVMGTTMNGNSSDKTVNNELSTNISKHMARHGIEPGAYVYVADSAFVTKGNLDHADEHKVCFLNRLPANFNEYSRAIVQAVSAGNWTDIGPLAWSDLFGHFDKVDHGVHTENERTAISPFVIIFSQAEIVNAAKLRLFEMRTHNIKVFVDPLGAVLVKGNVARTIGNIKGFARVVQRNCQRVITPLTVIGDIHPLFALTHRRCRWYRLL